MKKVLELCIGGKTLFKFKAFMAWPFFEGGCHNHSWPRTMCPPEPSSVAGKCTEACHLNPPKTSKETTKNVYETPPMACMLPKWIAGLALGFLIPYGSIPEVL